MGVLAVLSQTPALHIVPAHLPVQLLPRLVRPALAAPAHRARVVMLAPELGASPARHLA